MSPLARLRSPTFVLVVINVALFLLMLLRGGFHELMLFSSETLVRFGADYAPLVLHGQPERVFAAMFLHLNVIHLAMNMSALWSIGRVMEVRYGAARFVVMYLVSGAVGGVASLVWHLKSPVISAGASGAICGAIGAGIVAAHFAGPQAVALRNAWIKWAGTTLVLGAIIRADNAAHVGGLLSGAALGFVFRRVRPMPLASVTPAAALVAVVGVIFGAVMAHRGSSHTVFDWVNQGVASAKNGDHETALRDYQHALELDPKNATALYDEGLALRKLGRHAEAITAFEAALAREDSTDHRQGLSDAWVTRAIEAGKAGRKDEERSAYQAAIRVWPENASAHYDLGLSLEEADRYDEAITEIERAMQLSKGKDMVNGLTRALIGRAIASSKAGRSDDAVADYRAAISADPKGATAHYDLGIELERRHEDEGAIAELTTAMELAPSPEHRSTLADAWQNYAVALAKSGKRAESSAAMDRSRAIRESTAL